MPSPLAHASLILAAGPVVVRAAPRLLREPSSDLASRQTAVLLGLTAFAFVAPDLDFLPFLAMGLDASRLHGGPSHSLIAAALFAPLFGLAAARWAGARILPAMALGGAAYAMHIGLDLFNPGRGVGVLWPLQERTPTGLRWFEGAAHNDVKNWGRHRRTFLNEISFAAAMLGLGVLLWRATAPRGASPTPEETP
ncbi:MAG: metal-dependent hydrolase [Planctomycetota bacterium]